MWCMAIRMTHSCYMISSPWRRLVHHGQNVGVFFPRFQAGNGEPCILHALTSREAPTSLWWKFCFICGHQLSAKNSQKNVHHVIHSYWSVDSSTMDLYHCFQPVRGDCDQTPRDHSPLQSHDRPSQKLASRYWWWEIEKASKKRSNSHKLSNR